MRLPLIIALLILATQSLAEVLVPVRTLRASSVITGADLAFKPVEIEGAIENPEDLIGQEAKVTLYAGRPIFYRDIGPPALVTRNQIITLIYTSNDLRIRVDGRSLARGGLGDRVRVMNLSSRSTLFGTVQSDGTVLVQN